MADKRLLERTARKGAKTPSEVDAAIANLPDLSDHRRQPSEAELERLRDELATEQEVRSQRIERRLSENKSAPEPKVEVRITPLSEADI